MHHYPNPHSHPSPLTPSLYTPIKPSLSLGPTLSWGPTLSRIFADDISGGLNTYMHHIRGLIRMHH
jgi:hypothetical protein